MPSNATIKKRKSQREAARDATPALLQRIDIFSAEKGSKKSVSVLGGTVRVLYWESMLSDSVRASVTFTDSGNTLTYTKRGQGHGKRRKKVSAVEGLPITGSEKVYLKFTDNVGNTLDFGDANKNSLYINQRKDVPTTNESSSKTYMLDLAPLEFITNEKGGQSVRLAFSGQISDSVEKILDEVLKTKKNLDIEQTSSTLDFCGNNTKPYYTLNDLSTKSVSVNVSKEGETAGYFFWETADSYHFKSIDTLMSQEPKTKIIYNESSENIPEPYKVKALSMEIHNKVNVQQKFSMGAYSSRTEMIDPFNGVFTNQLNAAETFAKGDEVKLAGYELPSFNMEFNVEEADTDFSNTAFMLGTTGQLNYGGIEEQLSKSKELNFDGGKIFQQARMRYNQLFASEITILIPGDFSLHAGDMVWFDSPQNETTENKACGDDVDEQSGGKYLITDLCHYITAKDTYTKLVLIRDSFGRKGNPSKGVLSGNAKIAMQDNFLPNIK